MSYYCRVLLLPRPVERFACYDPFRATSPTGRTRREMKISVIPESWGIVRLMRFPSRNSVASRASQQAARWAVALLASSPVAAQSIERLQSSAAILPRPLRVFLENPLGAGLLGALLAAGGCAWWMTKGRPARIERDGNDQAASLLNSELFGSQQTPLLLLDADSGECVDCNPAALGAFGVERREQMLGHTPLDFSPLHQEHGKSSSELALRYMRTAMEQGHVSFEWMHRRPSGEPWPGQVHLTRVHCQGRDLLLCEVRDLSERKRADEELLAINQRFRLHFEQTPLAVVEWNPASRVVHWNPAAEEIFGYSAQEALGSAATFLVPEDEREHVQELWHQLMQRTGGTRSINDNLRRDGQRITCEWYNTPLVNERGRVIGVASLVRDITELRRSETERAQLEDQLRQAQKMEAVGQLAGGVAHDFNNLLQVIIGNLDLVRMRQRRGVHLGGELETIRGAATRAAELTRQLLAFSRRQVMAPTELDLNELVGSLLKMLRRLIGEHIDLQFQPCEAGALVRADRLQIEQMLMNLCVNARDAMPDGGRLTLRIDRVEPGAAALRVLPEAETTAYLRLGVSDTGHGMDAHVRERIFEPFFTTKEIGRGTGLGLSMVYGIVKQHHGVIDVSSRPGAGTTFWIYLPLLELNDLPAPAPDEVNEMQGGSETLLLAEDEPAVLSLVTELLREAGYRILTARDGIEAWEMYQAHRGRIDLTLLDIIMPRLGGLGVYERIVGDDPRMRFLFTSGYTDTAIDTHQFGNARLLRKPYSKDVLLGTVRELLDERAADRGAADLGATATGSVPTADSTPMAG